MNTETLPGRRAFYRGENASRMPTAAQMREPGAIVDHILDGWVPDRPFIDGDTNIVAFGSCFAANIGRYLNNLGFTISTQKAGKAYVQKISDGLVNVFAIAQQFEWAWQNRVPQVELWHGWKAEDYGYDEEVRLATKRLFDEADVFILTFGLSEVWYDEPTGEVFWRAVPEDRFDPSRHKFRVASHDETVEQLQRIYDLIRKHRPSATIIFTLSPVGLAATFRPVSCITANSVSKARLRSAIDAVHSAAGDANFYYFPSYEIVLHGLQVPFVGDNRHPHIHAIDINMKAFERYFCATGLTDDDLRAAARQALEADTFVSSADEADVQAFAQVQRERLKALKGASSAEKELAKAKRLAAGERREKARQKKQEARKIAEAAPSSNSSLVRRIARRLINK